MIGNVVGGSNTFLLVAQIWLMMTIICLQIILTLL